MQVQIAIDGPAASGKSTVAMLVAARLGGVYVNTGDMYRTVTRVVLDRRLDPRTDVAGVVRVLESIDVRYDRASDGSLELQLNGVPVDRAGIRAPDVAAAVSFVARIAGVRAWMLDRQRRTRDLGVVVMEGRDIGTVVFPDARHKFFLTASPAERARRRLAQGGETVPGATVESVAREIAERDRIDSSRAVAPLKPAADAIMIDSDLLTAAEVAERIVEIVGDDSGGTGP